MADRCAVPETTDVADSLRTSPYRYIVVPRGMPFFGVHDRATGELIRDDLTRREAREIVKRENQRV